MDLEAEISFHESSSMHADFPDTPQPEPQAKAPDASQTPVLEPQAAAGLAPQPQGAHRGRHALEEAAVAPAAREEQGQDPH